MTDAGGGLPPAGWYPDPTGGEPGQVRWWDGGKWTATIEIPPEPTIAPKSDYSWDAEVARYGEPETVNQRPLIDMIVVRDVPSRWGSVSVWLLALTPWLQLPAIAVVVAAVGISQSLVVAALVMAVIPLIVIAWAYRDRLRLESWGYHHSAHWAWMLLGPLVYLIVRYVRTRREAGIGRAPLITHIVSIVVMAAMAVGAVVYLPVLATPAVVANVESTIEREILVQTGIEAEVDCPVDVDIYSRETPFDCGVVDANSGQAATTRVYFTYSAGGTGDYFAYSTPVFVGETD